MDRYKKGFSMCGIVGIVSKRKKQIFDICEVEDMRKIQNHRGPNDSGVVGISMENRCGELVDKRKDYEGKSIVAFNRLSILICLITDINL